MSYGLYAAVSGSMVQEKRMEILSNNLANVNTAGFKEDRPIFREIYNEVDTTIMLTDTASQGSSMLAQKMDMGYLMFSGVKTDFSAGDMKYTGNPLDVAINGPGFFVVNTPRGELYTRTGNFSINDKGELVTHEGYSLKGKGESIKIEGTEITIDRKGAVTVDKVVVDTLKLVDFEDYTALRKVGDNLFEDSGGGNVRKAEECEIKHRTLELSNINIVKEMVKMIDVLRLYESYQKVIQSLDETTSRATREVGAVG
ncbi:MAG: flagellar basal-body rod protein FlgF, partial [Deltaproteobacteria bacterium]|jgi:flagellar basal-body rod protein FlgG|nr:flagellar basal-body rod protein FlgF [Deltaproteobacteria bacterium]MBW1854277.1 flagellar basal-body rod protein FlgF [Deltaproteobacteria bacterium]MCK5256238.1 flagellar basal-body rod protein FlgF [Deltaproteobacteria bacterium]MCK5422189.1 flagellar basal-body rod protein FlgF [Deltaproteobacteria bacterium]